LTSQKPTSALRFFRQAAKIPYKTVYKMQGREQQQQQHQQAQQHQQSVTQMLSKSNEAIWLQMGINIPHLTTHQAHSQKD
jgi:homoserine acetyltransferase